MFSVTIVAVGALRNKHASSLCLEYKKRIDTFAKLEIIEINPESSFSISDRARVQKKEEERILQVIEKQKGRVILLSEDGKQYASDDFAQLITKTSEKTIFIIGGSYGFSESFKNQYERCSLSLLTFPHEFARVILLEQLYRTITLSQNQNKYHK